MRRRTATWLTVAGFTAAAGVRAQPFDDVGPAWGLPSIASPPSGDNLVAAASFADLDGDGDLDLVRSGGGATPRVYRRSGPLGTFALDATAFDGAVVPMTNVRGHVLFDMDGDGDRDVLLLRDGRSALFANVAGALVDVSSTHLPSLVGWANSAAAGDLDGDGDLDLVVARYIDRVEFPLHHCMDNLVLENDGAGHFSDRSHDAGFDAVRGCSFVAALADLDADHDLDVVVVNDFARFRRGQEVWLNDGGFRFREVAADVGFVAPVYGMGVALADADQDGAWDAVVTDIGEPVALERDPATGVFADAQDARRLAVRFGAELHQVTWTAAWEDFDADGYLDLVMASGQLPAATFIGNGSGQRSVLLRGSASGELVELPAASGFNDFDHSARDVHFEDLDGDGRVEIVMAHINSRVAVYRNGHAVPTGALTTIELLATTTGAGAAGAEVRATACGVERARWVVGGASYGSADRGIVRIAWPGACAVTGQGVSGRVRWPSGYTQAFVAKTGATLRIEEPRWLEVGPDTVTVRLGDTAAPVTNVTFSGGANLSFSPTEQLAPGVFRATYAWSGEGAGAAAETQLDVVVDGETWGAHPRIRRAPGPALFVDPPVVPRGHPFLVATTPGAALAWDGDVVTADDEGVASLVAPFEVGDYPLVATDATGVTERLVAVGPAISRSRSELVARDLQVLAVNTGTAMARLRARLLDANGAPADVAPAELTVAIDGVAQAPNDIVRDSEWWTVRVAHSRMSDGSSLQLLIDGEPWFEPQDVAQLAVASDAATLVDASRSGCWLSEPRLWQGGDKGTVVGLLMDAHGARVSDFGMKPIWQAVGVTLPPDLGSQLGSLAYTATVQSGVGSGQVSLRLPGQDDPVVCEVPVGARPRFESPAAASVFMVGAPPVTLGVASPWRITPMTASGRGIGAGVDVELEVDGGEVAAPPTYGGLGRYDATITATQAGPMTVRAYDGDRLLATVTVDVFDPSAVVEPGPEPEPEPSPEVDEVDAGPIDDDASSADTSSADAAPDDVATADEDVATEDVVAVEDSATDATAPEDVVAVEDVASEDATGPTDAATADPSDAAVGGSDTADAASPVADPRAEVAESAPPRGRDDGCGVGASPSAVVVLGLALVALRGRRSGAPRARSLVR